MGVLEGMEIRQSYLPMFVMAGMGITMAVYSYYYANRKRHACLGSDDEEGEITVPGHSIDGNGTMNPIIKFNCLGTIDELKYRHDDRNDRLRFLKAVDRALQLYRGPKLKTFSLGCCFLGEYPSHLKRWMHTISGLDVEVLHLFSPCFDKKTPPFTFRFQLISRLSTLLTLQLARCYVEPGFVGQVQSLVKLGLMMVPFARDEMSDILLSCPNLQYLTLDCCKLPLKTRISGPNLKLKALALLNCSGLDELEISAVNLVEIVIENSIRVGLALSGVPKLKSLSLITIRTPPYCFGGDAQWDLPELKTLVLKARFNVNEIPWLPPTFDMFSNIRLLYLLMERCIYSREDCPQGGLCTFTPVLSACPFLETFYLMIGGHDTNEERGVQTNEERGVQWPVLRHKHLHQFEIAGFSNTQNELEFAKFILRTAEVLQKLVLRTSLIRCDGLGIGYFSSKPPCIEIEDTEAQLISQDLHGHALSVDAQVEIY